MAEDGGAPPPEPPPKPPEPPPPVHEAKPEADDEASHGKWKRRWVLSESGRQKMEEVYATDRFPSTTVREKLCREVGGTMRQVQVWFQNRRQREQRVHPAVIGPGGFIYGMPAGAWGQPAPMMYMAMPPGYAPAPPPQAHARYHPYAAPAASHHPGGHDPSHHVWAQHVVLAAPGSQTAPPPASEGAGPPGPGYPAAPNGSACMSTPMPPAAGAHMPPEQMPPGPMPPGMHPGMYPHMMMPHMMMPQMMPPGAQMMPPGAAPHGAVPASHYMQAPTMYAMPPHGVQMASAYPMAPGAAPSPFPAQPAMHAVGDNASHSDNLHSEACKIADAVYDSVAGAGAPPQVEVPPRTGAMAPPGEPASPVTPSAREPGGLFDASRLDALTEAAEAVSALRSGESGDKAPDGASGAPVD